MGVKVREKEKGSGMWWLFITHKGNRTSRMVGSKVEANRLAKELRGRLAGADFLPQAKPPMPTIQERWEHFEKNYLRSAVSESKAASYRRNFQKHILPTLGASRMDEVTDEEMETFVAELVTQGKAKSTIATILHEFGRLYTHAKKLVGGINPATGLSALYSQAKEAQEIHPLHCVFRTILNTDSDPS